MDSDPAITYTHSKDCKIIGELEPVMVTGKETIPVLTVEFNLFEKIKSEIQDAGKRFKHRTIETFKGVIVLGTSAVNSRASENMFGVLRGDPAAVVSKWEDWAKAGQMIGDCVAVFPSVGKMALGVGGEVFGFSLDATVVGAPAGVAVGTGSAVVISLGATTTFTALHNIFEVKFSQNGSGGADNKTAREINASSTRTVMRFRIERIKTSNTIPQGDWIKRFSPYLGIGKFMLIELKIPDDLLVDEFWQKLYNRVVQNLQEMEKGLKNGDWQNVLTISRKFYENIKFGDKKPRHAKFREQFDVIMKNQGHTDEGIQNLYDAIKNLFSFTSKYVHDKDTAGNLNPIVICTKEDAYLVYSLSIGLLNLIGKKISK